MRKNNRIVFLMTMLMCCLFIGVATVLYCPSAAGSDTVVSGKTDDGEFAGATLLTSENIKTADDLKAILAANPDGHFIFGEDIDLGGSVLVGNLDFRGILDGKGYTLKNFELNYNGGSDNGWNAYLFNSNAGTIKNIKLIMSAKDTPNNILALIKDNRGVLENIYVDFTLNETISGEYRQIASLVNKNDGGTIKNCIINMHFAKDCAAGLLASAAYYNLNNGTVQHCYAVNHGKNVPMIMWQWGVANNNAVFYTMSELVESISSFSASDGWSKYWKIVNGAAEMGSVETNNDINTLIVLNAYNTGFGKNEDERVNIYAVAEFSELFGEMTGEAPEIIYSDSTNGLKEYGNYFILGKELAFEDGHGTEELTTDTGYIIKKESGNIYLYGKTGYGTLNAVYGLFSQAFGLEFYTDAVYDCERGDFRYSKVNDEIFNPSIDYNWAMDGALTYIPENATDPNWKYQHRLGFVNSWQITAGSFHNFLAVLPPDIYSEEHPEWYTTTMAIDSGKEFMTLSLTDGGEEMASVVAQYIYNDIKREEEKGVWKSIFFFGPPDQMGWSETEKSKALKMQYGANSAEYILFMNKVAKILDERYSFGREIKLCMMAYNCVSEAPDYDNSLDFYDGGEISLNVMFAPIEMNMYRAMNDDSAAGKQYGKTNEYYHRQLEKWKLFGGEVYFWRYSAYYDNFFVPLDSISNMQSSYRFIARQGVKHFLDLGVTGDENATDFAALKIYLKSKLAKNVNCDVEELIKNFCNAYYGAGGEKMYELLTAERSWYR